ncbi:MAG: hypothetical protein P1U34_10460 [Coxiellaceae bacterium]|nr:hypothetical protein [Coxiellaceae bacterium]
MSRFFADFERPDATTRLLATPTETDTPPAPALTTAERLAAAGIDSFTFANVYFFLNQQLDASFGKDGAPIKIFTKEPLFQHIYRLIKQMLSAPSTMAKEDSCEFIALKYLQIYKLIKMDDDSTRKKDATQKTPRGYLPVTFKLNLYNRLLGIMVSQLSAVSADETTKIRATLSEIYDNPDERISYVPISPR